MSMKFSVLAGVAGTAVVGAVTMADANAATVGTAFDVTVTLSSQCKANTVDGAQSVVFPSYTAFQSTSLASTTPATLEFECTRGFSPTSAAYDVVNGNAAGVGVVGGLQYTLTANPSPSSTAGTAASVSTIGSGDLKTYTISGTLAAGQAGDSAAATTHSRTLIVTF